MIAYTRFSANIGLDWGGRKDDRCLKAMPGGAPERAVIEQRPEGIDDWANKLRSRFGNRPVAVWLELRKAPLVYAPSQHEHLVLFMVSPGLVAEIRKALRP